MTAPLSLECYLCAAPIGVPCSQDGTCCANRTARAELVGKAASLMRAMVEVTAGDPGRAAPAVIDEDTADVARPAWLPPVKGQS